MTKYQAEAKEEPTDVVVLHCAYEDSGVRISHTANYQQFIPWHNIVWIKRLVSNKGEFTERQYHEGQ